MDSETINAQVNTQTQTATPNTDSPTTEVVFQQSLNNLDFTNPANTSNAAGNANNLNTASTNSTPSTVNSGQTETQLQKENQDLQIRIYELNKLLMNALKAEVEVHKYKSKDTKNQEEMQQLQLQIVNLKEKLQTSQVLFEKNQEQLEAKRKTETADLSQQIVEFTAKLTFSESENLKLKTESTTLRSKFQLFESQILDLQTVLDAKNNRFEKEKQDLEACRKKEIAELNIINTELNLKYNLNLNDLSITKRNLDTEMNNNRELRNQVADLNITKNKYKDGMLEENILNNKLNEEIQNHRNSITQLDAKLVNQQRELDTAKEQLNRKIKLSRQLFQDKSKLREECHQYKNIVGDQQRELGKLNIELDQLRQLNNNLENQLSLEIGNKAKQESALLQLQQNCDEYKHKLQFNEDLKLGLENDLKVARIKIEKIENKLSEQTNLFAELSEAHHQKMAELSQVKLNEESLLRERIQNQKTLSENAATIETLNEKLAVSEARTERLMQDSAAALINFKQREQDYKVESAALIDELKNSTDTQITALQAQITLLETQNSTLQLNYDNLKVVSNRIRQSLEESRLKNKEQLANIKMSHEEILTANNLNIENLKAEIANLKLEIADFTTRNDKLAKESIELSNQLASKSTDFNIEKDQVEKWIYQLNNRELQIRQYVQHLEGKRNELKAHIQQFSAELSVSTALHPLKDYLRFTEYQVDKLSAQLKTLPLLSTDRSAVEAQLENLIEQKNFLRNITESSKEQIEAQSQELTKLMQIDAPIALPPMPKRNL